MARHEARPGLALALLLLSCAGPRAYRTPTPTVGPAARTAMADADEMCDGRRIYVLPIPAKFNRELMYDPARDTNYYEEWYTYDMLKHLEKAVPNAGFGKPIPSVLGLDSLSGAWYHTDQNTLENIFFARMRTYPCRVASHQEADLVYVPYFGGHDSLRNMHKAIPARDRLARELVPFLRAQPSWRRRNGSDHFMVLGRNVWDFNRKEEHSGWGSRLIPMDGVKGNMWIIVVETNNEVTKEVVSAPKPTSFHPKNLRQLREWQEYVRTRERTSLFSFAAGHRPLTTEEGILREKLFWQCENSKHCSLVDCDKSNGKFYACQDINQFFGYYMGATFCLHPMGDACSRRSVLDATLAGCIPVVFKSCTLEDQFQWHMGKDKGRMFVHIPLDDIKGPDGLAFNETRFPWLTGGSTYIEDVLLKIPPQEVRAMQRRVMDSIPRIIYGGEVRKDGALMAPDFRDSIDVIIDGLVANTKPRAM